MKYKTTISMLTTQEYDNLPLLFSIQLIRLPLILFYGKKDLRVPVLCLSDGFNRNPVADY